MKKDRVKRTGASAVSEAAARDPLPAHADLVIVGGGPHAVALVTRLLTRGEVLADANGPLYGYRKSPKEVRRHLFHTPVDESLKRSIVVIDKSGGWMLNWQRQYRAFGIKHLRSPESLHPDPYDHSALRVFATDRKLEADQFVEMKELNKTTTGNGRGRRRGGGTSLGIGHFRGPFTLPSVDVFAEFSSHLIDAAYGLGPLLREGEVTGMIPLVGVPSLVGSGRDEEEVGEATSTDDCGDGGGGGEVSGFELTVSLPDGGTTRMTAGTVVMARGPTARRRIPDWAKPFFHDTAAESTTSNPNSREPRASRSSSSSSSSGGPPRFSIAHAWDIIGSNATTGLTSRKQAASSPHESAIAPTDRCLVVGGGLTSAHLVVLLANRGVKDITLIFRGPRKVKNFDLPLPWFGDDRWVKRREFESASWPEKLRALKEERDGGSLTPELDAKIRALEAKGVCVVREHTEVRAASWIDGPADHHHHHNPNPDPDVEQGGSCTAGAGGHFEVFLDDDTDLRAERIWLATGSLPGVEDDPLFEQLLAEHPVSIRNGFPELTSTLRWSRDVPLYLMGGLAALQLGPDAVNLAGGLRGALRVSDELKQRMLELRSARADTRTTTSKSADQESVIGESVGESDADDEERNDGGRLGRRRSEEEAQISLVDLCGAECYNPRCGMARDSTRRRFAPQ